MLLRPAYINAICDCIAHNRPDWTQPIESEQLEEVSPESVVFGVKGLHILYENDYDELGCMLHLEIKTPGGFGVNKNLTLQVNILRETETQLLCGMTVLSLVEDGVEVDEDSFVINLGEDGGTASYTADGTDPESPPDFEVY